jgi:hypothetical protein
MKENYNENSDSFCSESDGLDARRQSQDGFMRLPMGEKKYGTFIDVLPSYTSDLRV